MHLIAGGDIITVQDEGAPHGMINNLYFKCNSA